MRDFRTQYTLSAFGRNGFAGPFRAITPEAAAKVRDTIERDVLPLEGPDPRSPHQSRHLDISAVLDICTLPVIVRDVQSILGANIVLWRSNFFPKPPQDGELRWHRDRAHWGDLLTPMINVTAWIALQQTSIENGCVQIIPHSNSEMRPPSEPRFADVPEKDAARAVSMEVEAGEYFLFDESVIHRSLPNVSNRSRLALAARFTRPDVNVMKERLFPLYRSFGITQDA